LSVCQRQRALFIQVYLQPGPRLISCLISWRLPWDKFSSAPYDSALETLRARAVLKGSSLEAEVRRLIESEGAPDRAALVDEMRLIRAKTPGTVPSLKSTEYREGLE
jgi:plasmid stability protein